MRNVTRAWLVLGDEDGPIKGLELPNITHWEVTAHHEPILWDLVNSYKIAPTIPFELTIELVNEGPFVERIPPEKPTDPKRGWKPKPSKEIAQ
jgi:hypothetical protein